MDDVVDQGFNSLCWAGDTVEYIAKAANMVPGRLTDAHLLLHLLLHLPLQLSLDGADKQAGGTAASLWARDYFRGSSCYTYIMIVRSSRFLTRRRRLGSNIGCDSDAPKMVFKEVYTKYDNQSLHNGFAALFIPCLP